MKRSKCLILLFSVLIIITHIFLAMESSSGTPPEVIHVPINKSTDLDEAAKWGLCTFASFTTMTISLYFMTMYYCPPNCPNTIVTPLLATIPALGYSVGLIGAHKLYFAIKNTAHNNTTNNVGENAPLLDPTEDELNQPYSTIDSPV